MASNIDTTKPTAGAATTASVRANFAAAKSEIEALQANASLVWTPVTFQNGWVNYGVTNQPCEYSIDEKKIVRLRGVMKSGTVGAAAFTLPAGFVPAYDQIFAATAANAFAAIDIVQAGEVIPISGSNAWFSLAGIFFQAA